MKSYVPTAHHQSCMRDFKEVLGKYKHLPAEELLALAAQLVGNITALQDQTKYTSAQVMQIVSENLVVGNETAIRDILGNTAGNA